MKLWEHPRLTGALCAAAVLACAAMPAAFLAVTDAAYIGRVVPVADPYTAPTPTADDYYILRQLAARRQDSAMLPRAEEPAAPATPKMYIGASASLQSMSYAAKAGSCQKLRRRAQSTAASSSKRRFKSPAT